MRSSNPAWFKRSFSVWFLVLSSGLPQLPDAAADTVPESTQIVAQLWKADTSKTSNGKMVESRYRVDLSAMTVTMDKNPTNERDREAGKQWQSSEATYGRLLNRLKETGMTNPDDPLGVAIREIEKEKSAGYLPGSQILVSPDGSHAVLSPKFGVDTLVDLDTLSAGPLPEKRALEKMPMAWSPNSQWLAFPSSDHKSVIVYDVVRRTIQSTIPISLEWPSALAWSADMRKMAILDLVGRRLKKSPLGLLAAFSGHPDFRNDLVLRVTSITGKENKTLALTSNLTEQSSYQYEIQWK